MPATSCTSRTLLLIALVLPTLVTWLYFVALADQPAAWQQGAYGVGKTIQFLLPLAWFFWLRRRISKDRPPPAWQASLVSGAIFGLAVLVAGLAVYHGGLKPGGFFAASFQAIQAKVQGLNLHTPARFLALGVFYALVHSLLEEYYWRWFVFRECRTQLSLLPAILVSSLGFMAHHVVVLAIYFGWTSPVTYALAVCVAVGGAFWAWLYERYGTLLGPWLSHLIIDAAIFAIGYDLLFGT